MSVHLVALPAMPQSMADFTPVTPTADRPDYWQHHRAVQHAMTRAGIAAGQLDASNAILLQIGHRERREWTADEQTMATRSTIILPRFDWPGASGGV